MGRKRQGPPASVPGHGEGSEQGGRDRPAEEERAGPLAIARHLKDDGRALILYTHAEREPV
jgi:hypothetical protein